jgi:outer membrane protein assembly factor BamA
MTYLMGGSNTIRGYKLKELGKELSGKNQLLGTLEYQYLLWDVREVVVYGFGITFGLEMAAFVDNGTAWNTDNQFNMDHNRTGYGFGLRPLIPAMEELRLDFGFSNDGFVFHFASGPKMTSQRARLR